MNIKNIKAIAEIVSTYNLTSIEVTEGDSTIKVEKNIGTNAVYVQENKPMVPMFDQSAQPTAPTTTPIDFNKMNEVKSPMVGVFYAAASPDSAPYVKIGDKVKKGDILCIIEAMKQMNEIVAEIDGEIADVCVNNGDIVEFDQTIFKVC